MKYEIIDITGNRWIVEIEQQELNDAIRYNHVLGVTPYGAQDIDYFRYKNWNLMGDKVVAFRETE